LLLGCCKEVSNAANQIFRDHCVCRCYRLITTMWFQWCHCHCCWACRTASFSIVDRFGVATKKWLKTTSIFVVNRRVSILSFVSTGIWYTFYTASHFVLS
jgi:hypothetical protein